LDIGNTETKSSEDARNNVDWVTVIGSVALLSLAAFAARRGRNELAAAAPFFCGFVLLSPLSWKAHYVVLIPAAVHLLYEGAVSYKRAIALAAYLIAFVLFNFTSPRIVGLTLAEWADEHSLVLVGALVVFIVCVLLNFSVSRKDAKDREDAKKTLV